MLPKIFISYARVDDEEFAKNMYDDLSENGFEVWRDREKLHSVQLTFHEQIKIGKEKNIGFIKYYL